MCDSRPCRFEFVFIWFLFVSFGFWKAKNIMWSTIKQNDINNFRRQMERVHICDIRWHGHHCYRLGNLFRLAENVLLFSKWENWFGKKYTQTNTHTPFHFLSATIINERMNTIMRTETAAQWQWQWQRTWYKWDGEQTTQTKNETRQKMQQQQKKHTRLKWNVYSCAHT